MPVPPFTRISDAEAIRARESYAAESARRNRELARLEGASLLARAVSSEQFIDALTAEVEGLKSFIHHARLAGAEAARILRDELLRLKFIDEARRRRGL